MGIVAIACDTVACDRGDSGGFVSGTTVAFVLLADTFDDPENARVILLSAAGLAVIGLLVAAGTVWWWRSSEVEHPALGPLEVMSSRSWWKGDYTSRRRRLEAVRPDGAEPAGPAATSGSEPVDLKAAALTSPREFDDLVDFPQEGAVGPGAAVVVPASDSPAVVEAGPVSDHDEANDLSADPHDDARDDTSVADVPRPIDPLLRLLRDE